MKNKIFALLLSCMAFLSCQSAHAGLIGEQLFIGYIAYSSNGVGDTAFFQGFDTLTVESPFSSTFGVVVDDRTITISPFEDFGPFVTLDSLQYNIEAVDGSLPALDWAGFATTFPNFDPDSRIRKSSRGFSVDFSGLPVGRNYAFSVNILGTTSPGDIGGGTVAVPELPIMGILAIGLLAFLRSRRQTQSNMHSRLPA